MEPNWTEIKKLVVISMYVGVFTMVFVMASVIICLVSWPWFVDNVSWLAPLNAFGLILFIHWFADRMVKRIRENYEQGK